MRRPRASSSSALRHEPVCDRRPGRVQLLGAGVVAVLGRSQDRPARPVDLVDVAAVVERGDDGEAPDVVGGEVHEHARAPSARASSRGTVTITGHLGLPVKATLLMVSIRHIDVHSVPQRLPRYLRPPYGQDVTAPSISRHDLNLLVYLDALLSERSVTRAAQRLMLSQPAMSAALSRLRTHFRDPILAREATPTGSRRLPSGSPRRRGSRSTPHGGSSRTRPTGIPTSRPVSSRSSARTTRSSPWGPP